MGRSAVKEMKYAGITPPYTALWSCIILLLSSTACADARTDSNSTNVTIRSMIGVAARRPNDSDLQSIKDAGINIVRLDLSWSATERVKGQYDFSAYMPAAKKMEILGIKPIYVLAYGNPLYAPLVPTLRYRFAALRPAAPNNPVAVDAYSRWAVAAARALEASAPIFEIWNEPDVDHWWPPRANAKDYGTLANTTCVKLRQAYPAMTIIGPGAADPVSKAGIGSEYLKLLARDSALSCMSAISTHNYVLSGDPLRDEGYLKTTKRILDTAALKNKPLWSTEWGWSATNGDLRYQANYLVKTFLISVASGVHLNIWYQWRDWYTNVDDSLNHYGLLSTTGAPKPAYVALRHMLGEIGDLQLKCAAPPSPDGFAAVFSAASQGGVLVAWGQHVLSHSLFRDPDSNHIGKDIFGETTTIHGSSVGDMPVYLPIDKKDVNYICASIK